MVGFKEIYLIYMLFFGMLNLTESGPRREKSSRINNRLFRVAPRYDVGEATLHYIFSSVPGAMPSHDRYGGTGDQI